MTPIVNGNMFPELHEQMLDPTEFNVLILNSLNNEHLKFLSQLEVLHNYIKSKIDDGTVIQIHAIKDSKKNMFEEQVRVTVHKLDNVKLATALGLIKQLDIDVVLDNAPHFSDKEVIDNDTSFKVVRDLDSLISECETFLVGRNIPWILNDAMWNTTWFARYYSRPGLCRNVFNFMGEAKAEYKYTDEQVERVRYLTNRIGQIDYSRDVLNSYLQKKRRVFRHDIKHQDYSFELNYHLSNYYFLISGGLDILARILNDVYGLKIKRYAGLGLEKEDFNKALQSKRPDIAKLYGTKKVKSWIEWIKERRNYIAHEAGMHHSPLVKEKAKKMTKQELEQKIDEQTDWDFLKLIYPPEQYQARRDMVANVVKLEDYEEELSDVMIVKTSGNTKLFLPLRNIDYDYQQFQDVIRKTVTSLQS